MNLSQMDTKTLNSSNNLTIGAIYTPCKWAKFAIEKYSLFDDWIAGKTIFDPAMGVGNLLASLIDYGMEKGYSLSGLPALNLFGMELNTNAYNTAIDKFIEKYDIDMRKNFFNGDILSSGEKNFDILFGNPPWCNFVDLPAEYKEDIKKSFFEYGLVDNPKKLLLGGSRIDIAALVIQKCILENLFPDGKAVFFLPLSLFLNDGAHTQFRKFNANGTSYSLRSIYDFENIDVFENIATRYGLALFEKKHVKLEHVPYFRFENDKWTEYKAVSHKAGWPLLVSSNVNGIVHVPQIHVSHNEKPRQGINACGAINVFVFNKYEDIDDFQCRVNDEYFLPKKYVYPLITGSNFRNSGVPEKWVLLPYNNKTGKPLAAPELENEPLLLDYLNRHKSTLKNRKGAIIQAYIKRGIWWALLGVGKYSFLNYKIVWEAYGKNSFRPQLFAGPWQANQSLQAFIPCSEKSKAKHLLAQLSSPAVEQYLLASGMKRTMNWAQPGKISSILQFKNN
jgi:hypothetical protein